MTREVTHRYADPVDLIWARTAERVGITLRRSDEVFASWDGAGTLTLGAGPTLDADDSLAQLVFHELCHALVEGPEAWHEVDWGLENRDDRDLWREHAALRLQAALADRHGLRRLLAATTDFSDYYDALAADPLAAAGDDPAIAPARAGWRRATEGPWAEPLRQALEATAAIADATGPFAAPDSLWSR